MTAGYEPRFDLDLRFGHEGERQVGELLRLPRARIEVKTERFQNTRVFVETLHLPQRANGYEPSGLLVSESAYWVFVKPGPLFVFVPPEVLKRRIHAMEQIGMPPIAGGLRGDSPTKGYLVDLVKLFEEGS